MNNIKLKLNLLDSRAHGGIYSFSFCFNSWDLIWGCELYNNFRLRNNYEHTVNKNLNFLGKRIIDRLDKIG